MKLGINLHKEIYKTDDEIKELNKWRNIPYSWIGRFNIVKTLVPSNLLLFFNIMLASVGVLSLHVNFKSLMLYQLS